MSEGRCDTGANSARDSNPMVRSKGALRPEEGRFGQLKQDKGHRQDPDGDVQLARGKLADEMNAHDDPDDDAGDKVEQILAFPFAPVVIERKGVSRAEQGQQNANRKTWIASASAKGQDT